MSKPKIYECKPCVQLFTGRKDYDYHMRAHRRVLTATERDIARTTSEDVLPLVNRPTGAATHEGNTLWKSS